MLTRQQSSTEVCEKVDKFELHNNVAYNRYAVIVQHFPAEVHDVQRQLGYAPRMRIARLWQPAHRHVLVTDSFYLQKIVKLNCANDSKYLTFFKFNMTVWMLHYKFKLLGTFTTFTSEGSAIYVSRTQICPCLQENPYNKINK